MKYEIKNMNGAVLSAHAHIGEVLEQLRNYADAHDEFNYQLNYKGECICYGTAAEIIAWIME
jgi:hypothetical protein